MNKEELIKDIEGIEKQIENNLIACDEICDEQNLNTLSEEEYNRKQAKINELTEEIIELYKEQKRMKQLLELIFAEEIIQMSIYLEDYESVGNILYYHIHEEMVENILSCINGMRKQLLRKGRCRADERFRICASFLMPDFSSPFLPEKYRKKIEMVQDSKKATEMLAKMLSGLNISRNWKPSKTPAYYARLEAMNSLTGYFGDGTIEPVIPKLMQESTLF